MLWALCGLLLLLAQHYCILLIRCSRKIPEMTV